MSLRDGLEDEVRRLEDAQASRDREAKERADAMDRLQQRKRSMIQELTAAIGPDLGYLEELGVRISVEPDTLVFRGPHGTISVAVEQEGRDRPEYVIHTVARSQGSLRPERSEAVEAAATKVGRAAAHIKA